MEPIFSTLVNSLNKHLENLDIFCKPITSLITVNYDNLIIILLLSLWYLSYGQQTFDFIRRAYKSMKSSIVIFFKRKKYKFLENNVHYLITMSILDSIDVIYVDLEEQLSCMDAIAFKIDNNLSLTHNELKYTIPNSSDGSSYFKDGGYSFQTEDDIRELIWFYNLYISLEIRYGDTLEHIELKTLKLHIVNMGNMLTILENNLKDYYYVTLGWRNNFINRWFTRMSIDRDIDYDMQDFLKNVSARRLFNKCPCRDLNEEEDEL